MQDSKEGIATSLPARIRHDITMDCEPEQGDIVPTASNINRKSYLLTNFSFIPSLHLLHQKNASKMNGLHSLLRRFLYFQVFSTYDTIRKRSLVRDTLCRKSMRKSAW